MFKIKTKKKKLIEETYDLNYSFILWLNEHLKVYKEHASKIIDLTYHKIKIDDTEYNLEEALDVMIRTSNRLLDEDYYDPFDKNYQKDVDTLLKFFTKSFDLLWW